MMMKRTGMLLATSLVSYIYITISGLELYLFQILVVVI